MTVYVFIAEVNSRCEAASRRQLLGPFSDWQPRQLTLAHTSPDQHLSRALRPLGLVLYSNTILKQVCQRQWPRWVSGCRRSVWRCSASLESVSSTTCMQGSSPAAWLLSGDDDIYIHIRSHYLTVLTVIVCAGAALEVILSVDEWRWRWWCWWPERRLDDFCYLSGSVQSLAEWCEHTACCYCSRSLSVWVLQVKMFL